MALSNDIQVGLVSGGDRRAIAAFEALPIDSLWVGGHIASRNPTPEGPERDIGGWISMSPGARNATLEDGRIWFRGRCREVLMIGGANVAPSTFTRRGMSG